MMGTEVALLLDIVECLVLLWLIIKLGKLEKEVELKVMIPMYYLHRHIKDDHREEE